MSAAQKLKNIVLIGGGHCNCQVLKMLKKDLKAMNIKAKMTLVTEAPLSYYSGMLPGAASHDDIKVYLEPIADWCEADYIEKRVEKIDANNNMLHFEGGGSISYDALGVNVGSRTRGANDVKGVNQYSLTTRPINDLLGKIQDKEDYLIQNKITPSIAVCGSGAAGIELAFAFKNRWTRNFNKDIKTKLLCSASDIMLHESEAARLLTKKKLEEHGIEIVTNARIDRVEAEGVILSDGRKVEANVPVWATGAEAQKVTVRSNLAILDDYFSIVRVNRGATISILGGVFYSLKPEIKLFSLNGISLYFRVNDFLQSTSHPNVFGGGDCIQMETYSNTFDPSRPKGTFPTKAGVYAVREGPILAQNLVSYIAGQEIRPLQKYVPQSGFLALLMTGDGKAIGTKFGIAFAGKWVWRMKDYIDVGFMRLFHPEFLYSNYDMTKSHKAQKAGLQIVENNALFEDEKAAEKARLDPIRAQVAAMSPKAAASALACSEEEEEFFERLFVIDRMGKEEDFMKATVEEYRAIERQRQVKYA